MALVDNKDAATRRPSIHEFSKAWGNLSMLNGEPGHPGSPAHLIDESPAGYSSAGCAPAVKFQTEGLDEQARNSWRVGSGLLYAEGNLRRRQLRPRAHWCLPSPTRSVVPSPVLNTVMTSLFR